MKLDFKKVKWNHYVNYAVIGAITVIFAILSLTGNTKSSTEFLLEKLAISITLAVSLSIVVGFLGELSLGHAGFMCIGAYFGGKVASLLDSGADSIPVLILTLFIGGAAAAVFGFVIGLPALRLKGDYLAIVTLAFGEIVRSIFLNTSSESFGGALGIRTPRYSSDMLFIFAFLVVLLCLFITQNLIRSKHGRAITAIRDNEIAARATGINVTKYKLVAFMVSAFFAGVAGVLYSHANFTVQSQMFDYNYSIEILVMVVLGGMGNINGSIVSAALITFLNVELATVLTGDLAVLKDLIYALILIAIVIYNNAPALKSFRERFNTRVLWRKLIRKPEEPSARKDDEGEWARVPTKIDMDEVLSLDVYVTESVITPDKPDKGGNRNG